MQAADLDAIMQDYPCTLTVAGISVACTAGDIGLDPLLDGRGITESGSVLVAGKTADLQAAGGMAVAQRVELKRYGVAVPVPYTVESLRQDEVGWTATLAPVETRRTGGMVL